MIKNALPNIPGVGVMTDTLDFVKNLWGSMNVPGMNLPNMATPTLSVDELDKKIQDLRTVEAWLNMNATMLRSTIQALEVQRGTIATLKSMGATLANAVKQPGANEESVLKAAPFVSALFSAAPPEADKAAAPEASSAESKPDATPEADKGVPPMGNPAQWWNLLQDQFRTAVSTAMSTDALAGATAMATDAAQKFAANASKAMKPAAKAKSGPRPAAKTTAKTSPARKRAPAKPRTPKA